MRPHSPIDNEQVSDFLARQNSLLESLIQIYKQFLKMNASTSREGQSQLNKKLCIIESLKFYVEHLILFHKFHMLASPPPLPMTTPSSTTSSHVDEDTAASVEANTNYLHLMQVNLEVIQKRWLTRRQNQMEQQNGEKPTAESRGSEENDDDDDEEDITYPFTYMIDCLFEECKGYANVAPLFTTSHENGQMTKSIGEIINGGYPPKSLIVS